MVRVKISTLSFMQTIASSKQPGATDMRHYYLLVFSIIAATATVDLVPDSETLPQVQNEKEACEQGSSKVPKFRVVRKRRPFSKPGLELFVRISPSEVDRDKLIALSCHLGREYAREEMLNVWILDSERAAKRYNPQGEGNDEATASSFRAFYGFHHESASGSQSLEWKPDPNNRNRLIHIDLGAAP
jgi:hypothetical protein